MKDEIKVDDKVSVKNGKGKQSFKGIVIETTRHNVKVETGNLDEKTQIVCQRGCVKKIK